MFSPSLSPSLSDDAAAAAANGHHPSCVVKTELKATLQGANSGYHGLYSPRNLLYFIFSNYLTQVSKQFLTGTLSSEDEDFCFGKGGVERRNLGFVVYTR